MTVRGPVVLCMMKMDYLTGRYGVFLPVRLIFNIMEFSARKYYTYSRGKKTKGVEPIKFQKILLTDMFRMEQFVQCM